MTSSGPTVDRMVLVVAASCLSVVLLLLLVALLSGRWWLRRTGARRAELLAPGWPLLVALAAGDDEDDALGRLVALSDAQWRVLEPVVVSMLGKVRGDARAALVELLDRRGSVHQAGTDVRRRRGSVRARAAHLLGFVGGPGTLPRLTVLLGDRDPEVRAVAVGSLGRLGEPGAAMPLVRSLAQPTARLPRQAVMAALARIGPPARAVLLSCADHPDEVVRARVVEALGLTGAVAAAPRLLDVLRDDGSTEVRLRAARALGCLERVC